MFSHVVVVHLFAMPSSTPLFDCLLQSFDVSDRHFVLKFIGCMLLGRRLPKHLVVCTYDTERTKLLFKLVYECMPTIPSIFTYMDLPKKHWTQNLKLDIYQQEGVEYYIQNSKLHRLNRFFEFQSDCLLQHAVMAFFPTKDMVQNLHFLAPERTNLLRIVKHSRKTTVAFYEWQAPLFVIHESQDSFDLNLFRVVHMNPLHESLKFNSIKCMIKEIKAICMKCILSIGI